jgi:hypothetical protein
LIFINDGRAGASLPRRRAPRAFLIGSARGTQDENSSIISSGSSPEQADFKAWLADAVAALQREHNINPAIIPVRVWRRFYIRRRTPPDAADQAADRLKRR